LDTLFIARFDHPELLPQSSGKGGGGSHFISPVWGEGRRGGGGNRRSSQDYQDCREKPDHFHLVSDRASNYFVSGEDDIKPGSIPGVSRAWMRAFINIFQVLVCGTLPFRR
jgi:hypothetical protein